MTGNRRSVSACLVVGGITVCLAAMMNTAGSMNASTGRESSPGTDDQLPISPAQPASFDFAPVQLERLIGTADLIVLGTVAAVDGKLLSIRVDESFYQRPPTDLIAVTREKIPEIFPPRRVPYAKGQQFVFFLTEEGTAVEEERWSILGFPIAGELPVENDMVYFGSYDIEGFAFEASKIHGVERPMQRFDLADFKNAVGTYRDCFSWSQVASKKNQRVLMRWVPVRVCDESALQDYRQRSPIHEYLTRVTERQIPDSADSQ